MGLRADLQSGNGAVFSEDVLKIEIHGPKEEHLTIIDVPGIFRTTTQGTTKEDMAMVRDLVKSYIKESRTIILAVLPSNVDVATQEILELAEEFDKKGERTIGVLTKPDLVLEPGAQAAVCNLVQGNRRPLNLGYFLVRNRGADNSVTTQLQLDQFFDTQPWNGLPHDRLGIAALKTYLAPLLLEITRQNFPRLSREINGKIRECSKELDSLGPARQEEREQRSFLTHIAGVFQDRTRAALAADYNADVAFDQDDLRLITHIANITDLFSVTFQDGAHTREFEPPRVLGPSVADEGSDEGSDEVTEEGQEEYQDEYQDEVPHETCPGLDDKIKEIEMTKERVHRLFKHGKVEAATPEERDELGDIMIPPRPFPAAQGNITEWIRQVYVRSRGLDLGTFNPNFVSVAFAEQSRKWHLLTWGYMNNCIITVHRFIAATLRSVWPENQGRDKLWAAIIGDLVKKYKVAMDQADLLIEVERRKQPYTLNPQFAKALSKARGNRIAELLAPTARRDTTQYGEAQYMVNLDDITEVAQEKRNVEQLQEEIHDILQAYYQLALDRFMDNVFQLAVDYHLLHGPSSPLKVFNQEWVIDLGPEELERIVGEAKSAKAHRSRLQKKITDFSRAIEILRS